MKTTEPIVWQVLLMVAGSLLAAVLGALVAALAAGVGAWAARTAPRAVLAGNLPPWAAGAAAALFVAGMAALAGRSVPQEAPLWPSLALESTALPWAAAALQGVGVLSSIGVGLFVLHLLERLTAGWSRRSWIAVAAVVALIAGLDAVRSGEVGSAIAAGVVAGLLAAAIVYFVLRFDPRTVPGYIVTVALIGAAENAALKGTSAGWIAFAVVASVSVVAAAAATRYLDRPLPPQRSDPASAGTPA